MNAEFEIFYPGQYSEKDSEILAGHRAEWASLSARGDVNIADLVSGKVRPEDIPGVSRRVMRVTDWEAEFYAKNYDWNNKLYFDSEVAKNFGYRDKLAMPSMCCFDGAFFAPMPSALSDTFYVSGLTHKFNI